MSTLSLISKLDKYLQKIYHLLYLNSRFINNHITNKMFFISYIFLQKFFIKTLTSEKCSLLIKHNVKNSFQNIFINSYMQ